MVQYVRYTKLQKLKARGKKCYSHIALVCKYCFEEIHLPVYETFQRIPTSFGTIKQDFLCVCVC